MQTLRTILLCVTIASSAYCANGQAPEIEWQKCLGGTGTEEASCIRQTKDGGYIIAGNTNSGDGDVTNGRGSDDFWIVKLDGTNSIEWQKCLGGTSDEQAFSVQQTTDGGYIVFGTTTSNDGDVSGNHGKNDYWVVKLDDTGSIKWQKCLGGSGDDRSLFTLQQTKDGGYIIAGLSESYDGDVSGNHGKNDYWVVKLDDTGRIEWQKCLGGSGNDVATSVQQTADGGYIVVGYSESYDGDVSGNHGQNDSWVVKLDDTGRIEWQKCLGGSGNDVAASVKQTADGGYIIAGATASYNGDVSGNHGSSDIWIIKLDDTGNIKWQKCLGGSGFDLAFSLEKTADSGYIIAGFSESYDGDVSGNHGSGDAWIVKLSSTGTIEWQKCIGGTSDEWAYSVQQTTDGGYVVAGFSESHDGDVSGNHGNADAWIVKLTAETTHIKELQEHHLSIYPNPTQHLIHINASGKLSYELSDINGKVIIGRNPQTTLDLSTVPAGLYIVTAYDQTGIKIKTEKIIKTQ